MSKLRSNLQKQTTCVLESRSARKPIIFVSVPVIALVFLINALMMAAGPNMQTLISSNDAEYLDQVIDYLEQNNIEYETPDDRTIAVSSDMKARAMFGLAQENLIGGYEGPGYELFDTMRLGMNDELFRLHQRQALENELEKIIRTVTNCERVIVRFSIPQPQYFKEDEVLPTAAVKIEFRCAPSQEQLAGIRNIVAFAVPGLNPEHVVVIDRNNKPLAGTNYENELN